MREGWEIYLLSYAGHKRGQEVVSWAQSLPIHWSHIRIVEARCGVWGKASWAQHLGCTHLADDHAEICQEAWRKGLKVYPVTTRRESHEWAQREGVDTFRTFLDVAAALLDGRGKRGLEKCQEVKGHEKGCLEKGQGKEGLEKGQGKQSQEKGKGKESIEKGQSQGALEQGKGQGQGGLKKGQGKASLEKGQG